MLWGNMLGVIQIRKNEKDLTKRAYFIMIYNVKPKNDLASMVILESGDAWDKITCFYPRSASGESKRPA